MGLSKQKLALFRLILLSCLPLFRVGERAMTTDDHNDNDTAILYRFESCHC